MSTHTKFGSARETWNVKTEFLIDTVLLRNFIPIRYSRYSLIVKVILPFLRVLTTFPEFEFVVD